MKRHILLALVISLLSGSPASAQRQYWNWYFSYRAAITFPGGGSPVALMDSPLEVGVNGSSTISDPSTGRLLFYGTMSLIWDRTHRTMLNGDSSRGCRTWNLCNVPAQSALALRRPGSPDRYVLITVERDSWWSWDTLAYTAAEIDMTLNGGLGAVTDRNIPLWHFGGAQLTAVRMCGRDGYWIIGHEPRGNRFVIIPFDSTGFGTARSQDIGEMYSYGLARPGYMKATANGRRIAVAGGGEEPHVQVIDFNPSTGRLADTPAVKIWMGRGGAYGASFSPSGRWLFVTGSEIDGMLYRFDLSTSDSLAVAVSRRRIADNDRVRALQLGPDGRIHVAIWGESALGVINDPESSGDPKFGRGVDLGFNRIASDDLPNMVESELGLRYITSQRAAICLGDSTRLSSRWVSVPRWSPATGLSCTSCAEPIASPRTTTTYYLHDSVTEECGAVDSFTVIVNAPPEITVRGDTLLCVGEATDIEVLGGQTVRWRPSGDLSCTDCRRVTITPRRTSIYYFEVASAEGCAVQDSVRVQILPSPQPNLGPDVSICAGDSVRLRADGGQSYRWTPASGLSCDTCPAPVARPSESTTYHVKVTNAAGCSGADDIRVSVLPAGQVDAGRDTSVCPGEPVRLGASGATVYRWDPSPELSCLDCADPLVRPLETTTYFVTGTNEFGCKARDSLTVVVRQRPSLALEGDPVICSGGSTRISVQGADRYRWWASTGGMKCETCDEQIVSPTATTTYYVLGTTNDCGAIDSFTVTVVDRPVVSISGGGEICHGGKVRLLASGASAYSWSPSEGLSCSDCADPIASPAVTTTYRVIGSLAIDCSDTAFVTVAIIGPKTLAAAMDRGVEVLPGERRTMAISLDQQVVTDSLAFEMTWNRAVARVDNMRPAIELEANGWSVEDVASESGRYAGVLRRAAPTTIGPGDVIELTVTAFLGDSVATELPLTITASVASCATFDARAGQVLIDSICGLSFRLIEASDALLKLSTPVPNPITDRTTVTYSLPFDGEIALVLVDGRGIARTLEAGYRSKGQHEVVVDARDLAGGVYDLRLLFGESVRQVPMVVVK